MEELDLDWNVLEESGRNADNPSSPLAARSAWITGKETSVAGYICIQHERKERNILQSPQSVGSSNAMRLNASLAEAAGAIHLA